MFQETQCKLLRTELGVRTQTSEVIGLAVGSFRPHGREEKRARWIGVLSCDQSEGTGISSSPAHSQPSHWPALTLDSNGPIDSFQRCLTMERARGTRKEEGWRPLSLAVSAGGLSLVFSSESDDAAPPSTSAYTSTHCLQVKALSVLPSNLPVATCMERPRSP